MIGPRGVEMIVAGMVIFSELKKLRWMPSQVPPTQNAPCLGQALKEKLCGKAIKPFWVISGNSRNELATTTNSGRR